MLTSLQDAATVAVVGASGGIGGALSRRLAASPRVGRFFALSRRPLSFDDDKVVALTADIGDEASLAAVARRIDEEGGLDLAIVASGVLHAEGPPRIAPERRLREIDAAAMLEVLRVNTVGPALVAKHFLPLMRRGRKSVFAALSARVGSIGDNRLGGWVSYRASKAALNMALKTLAIEQSRTRPDCVVIGLHPGTVATGLSEPFRANVPDGKLFSPSEAADHLLGVIDRVQPSDTGRVFAWDGQIIEP